VSYIAAKFEKDSVSNILMSSVCSKDSSESVKKLMADLCFELGDLCFQHLKDVNQAQVFFAESTQYWPTHKKVTSI
jgi:hypothetical protein